MPTAGIHSWGRPTKQLPGRLLTLLVTARRQPGQLPPPAGTRRHPPTIEAEGDAPELAVAIPLHHAMLQLEFEQAGGEARLCRLQAGAPGAAVAAAGLLGNALQAGRSWRRIASWAASRSMQEQMLAGCNDTKQTAPPPPPPTTAPEPPRSSTACLHLLHADSCLQKLAAVSPLQPPGRPSRPRRRHQWRRLLPHALPPLKGTQRGGGPPQAPAGQAAQVDCGICVSEIDVHGLDKGRQPSP